MKKVLVAEIGHTTIILTAFGDLDTDHPLLLGQENTYFGLEKGIRLLEKDIGVSDPEYLECYIVSALEQEGLQQVIEILDLKEKDNIERDFAGETSQRGGMAERWFEAKILKPHEAIDNFSSVFLKEVGEVLILKGDRASSIDLYLIQENKPLHVGRATGTSLGSRARVNPPPRTAEELATEMEYTAQTLQEAIHTFCQGSSDVLTAHSTRDLTQLRWVIGTGSALATLPSGLEVIRDSLVHCDLVKFPEAGFPILIDRDNILMSLGALTDRYHKGAWQLLLESLGIDS